tara:strand:+ start:4172 stop:4498 length:327 start_codon:yes stop_codon:yes gene_type:complete
MSIYDRGQVIAKMVEDTGWWSSDSPEYVCYAIDNWLADIGYFLMNEKLVDLSCSEKIDRIQECHRNYGTKSVEDIVRENLEDEGMTTEQLVSDCYEYEIDISDCTKEE